MKKMSETVTCDRCMSVCHDGSVKYYTHSSFCNSETTRLVRRYDLCEKCERILTSWMNEIKEDDR